MGKIIVIVKIIRECAVAQQFHPGTYKTGPVTGMNVCLCQVTAAFCNRKRKKERKNIGNSQMSSGSGLIK